MLRILQKIKYLKFSFSDHKYVNMTSISKFEADYEQNVVEVCVNQHHEGFLKKIRCHQFSFKENPQQGSTSLEVIPGKAISSEWLYGAATMLETRTVVYPCVRFKCAVPCPCLLCRKVHPKCRVPANQGCSCEDCLRHFQDHTQFHRTFKFGCKSCFQLMKAFPCFNFFFLEKWKNPLPYSYSVTGPLFKKNVAHVEPKVDKYEIRVKFWYGTLKRDTRPHYQCPECNLHGADAFSFTTSEQFLEHIELNHVGYTKMFRHSIKQTAVELSEQFKCYQCSTFFSTTRELNRHIESVHYKESYNCQDCPKIFSRKDSLMRHEKNFHKPATHNHSCEMCGNQYVRKDDLLRHMNVHTGDGKKLVCTFCDSAFRFQFDLKKHSMGIYDDDGFPRNVCLKCDKNFCTGKMLKAHTLSNHGVDISCEVCSTKFTQKKSLISHLKTRSPTSCKICKISFCYEADLKIHIESVHSMITCGECKIEFKEENMRMHKYWAHGGKLREVTKASVDTDDNTNNDEDIKVKLDEENVVKHDIQLVKHLETCDSSCSDCGKQFGRKDVLIRHRKSMHVCTQCDQKFCTTRVLKKHIQSNHVIISCKVCGETFSRKSSLEAHIRKGFESPCSECDLIFCNLTNLSKHKKAVHTYIPCDECGQLIEKKFITVHKSWAHK